MVLLVKINVNICCKSQELKKSEECSQREVVQILNTNKFLFKKAAVKPA